MLAAMTDHGYHEELGLLLPISVVKEYVWDSEDLLGRLSDFSDQR